MAHSTKNEAIDLTDDRQTASEVLMALKRTHDQNKPLQQRTYTNVLDLIARQSKPESCFSKPCAARSLQEFDADGVVVLGVLDIEGVFVEEWEGGPLQMVVRTAALALVGRPPQWWDVRPPKKERELTLAERIQNSSAKHVHGIPFDPIERSAHRVYSVSEFADELKMVWEELVPTVQPPRGKTACIAFKGGSIETELLSSLGIPSFDIGLTSAKMAPPGVFRIKAPKIDDVPDQVCEFPVCEIYHRNPRARVHCCLQEVCFYLDWLQRNHPTVVWAGPSKLSLLADELSDLREEDLDDSLLAAYMENDHAIPSSSSRHCPTNTSSKLDVSISRTDSKPNRTFRQDQTAANTGNHIQNPGRSSGSWHNPRGVHDSNAVAPLCRDPARNLRSFDSNNRSVVVAPPAPFQPHRTYNTDAQPVAKRPRHDDWHSPSGNGHLGASETERRPQENGQTRPTWGMSLASMAQPSFFRQQNGQQRSEQAIWDQGRNLHELRAGEHQEVGHKYGNPSIGYGEIWGPEPFGPIPTFSPPARYVG